MKYELLLSRIVSRKSKQQPLHISMETKGLFQFEIITNVLVRSLRFSRIPMLWVYGAVRIKGFTNSHVVFKRLIKPVLPAWITVQSDADYH